MKHACLTSFFIMVLACFLVATVPGPLQKIPGQATLKLDLGKFPLHFIANPGQVNKTVCFYATTSHYTLWLTPTGLVFDRSDATGRNVVRCLFQKANPAPVLVPSGALNFKVNHLKGQDVSQWVGNIPTSAAVVYQSLYPGINLKVYGLEKQVEYDWLVKPGANPNDIRFQFTGVKDIWLDHEGNMVMAMEKGDLIQKRPYGYQMFGTTRHEVSVGFKKLAPFTYGFQLGHYDDTRELIIDPVVLAYSTGLGGSSGCEIGAMAMDSSGFVYVTGATYSPDFPEVNSYEGYHAANDVFVTKIDPNQPGPGGIMYSTYLGGGADDDGKGIAVSDSGVVYVTGMTSSSDFPQLNGYQTYQGGEEAFLVKLDTNQSGAASLLYATFLGGSDNDHGRGVVVDNLGQAYIAGITSSSDFPLVASFQSDQPQDDGFVAKIDTHQSGSASLLYSTYLGGDLNDYCLDLALDNSHILYVTGLTGSSDFPVQNAYQSVNQGYRDAFVTKIDASQSGAASLIYSTYIGGSDEDEFQGIAVDNTGKAYLVGNTFGTDFPTVNPFMVDPGDGNVDVVVAKLDTTVSGSAGLLYATYLGSSEWDTAWGIALDSAGNVYVTGDTSGTDFPLLNEYQGDPGDADADAFVAKINPNLAGAASLIYSTYLGGNGMDRGVAVAVDSAGSAFVVGRTTSSDFPLLGQMYPFSSYDSFLTTLDFPMVPTITVTAPNGGESWELGTTQPITWNTDGVTANVKITLWQNGVNVGVIASSVPPSPGIFNWKVGDYVGGAVLAGSGYKIKVKDRSAPVADFSDAFFNIARIKVTSPNGGETLIIGAQYNITWIAQGVTKNLRITLWQNGTLVGIIADNVPPGLGSLNWTIGSYDGGTATAGTGFKIKIKEKTCPVADMSNNPFTLSN